MTPVQIATQFVEILTSMLTAWAQGIGGGINSAVTAMFFTGTGESQALSIYAVMVLIFAALALGVSLTRLIFNWLSNLGGGR